MTHDVEVLARSTSVKDALEVLKGGTILWKIRNKGVRGIKIYRRKYKLDIVNLRIVYFPNKSARQKASNCVRGTDEDEGFSYDLSNISEVRSGHGTDTFNQVVIKSGGQVPKVMSKEIPLNCCFSFITKDHESLDLVAEDESIRDLWVETTSHLIMTIRSLGHQKEYEMFLKKQFKKADENKNGSLTFEECRDLVDQLNIKMSKEELKVRFNFANVKKAKGREEEALDEEEFIAFYYSLMKRPELEEYYSKYAKTERRMSPADLADFQKKEQKEELLLEECEQLIEAFEPRADKSSLSLEGFIQFMMFSELQLITGITRIYQDMSQPMSHYWIASSHNTYLTGNQVTGESSIDAYVKVLKEGCRCVELDCWDGDDGEPIIYHGWTLTSKILIKEVLSDAIKPYAFHSTDYPLILSIENHCSLEMQDKIADYMINILGDLLYKEPVDESLKALPSPESLRRKILIKAKRLPPGKNQDDEMDDYDEVDDERDEKKKKVSKKVSKKLSDLVNYIHAVHFEDFETSKKEATFFHMSSFGESKAMKIIEDPEEAVKFVDYNTRQLSRIYPGAKRQDSSNLKVLPPWNAGCQIVALNYQTEDKQNFYNRARFQDNGGCGYVLKPEYLRDSSFSYSPISPSKLDPEKFPSWNLKVTIISGQHIPRPSGRLDGEVIDPYVKVRIRGHPDDNNKGKTQAVSNNGFNPIWEREFEFHVNVPSLAFLEFKVKDHSKSGSDKDIGSFFCPLRHIKEGYRRVYLRDYSGKELSPASLFVHIEVTHNK